MRRKSIKILDHGRGELLAWEDSDAARRWVLENKTKELIDKRMPIKEAVSRFVNEGNYLVLGGFGHIRISMAAVHEIIRQRKKGLILGGKTAVFDADILIAAGCVEKIEVAYSFGHELRGLAAASRRAVESGRVKVAAETSNAGLQWRYLAGAMGVDGVLARNLLGTDTFKKSSCKIIESPLSGKPLCFIPAAYPDACLMHVHRADIYGNCQIDGTIIEDIELARASKRLIVTCEKIISNEEIREKPWLTKIPYFLVDAVVEVPYGSHPCQMPLLYYFDEEHYAEWLELSRTDEGAQKYFRKYIFGVEDFTGYLQLNGGDKKMKKLQKIEFLKELAFYPWLKR